MYPLQSWYDNLEPEEYVPTIRRYSKTSNFWHEEPKFWHEEENEEEENE